MESVHPSQRQDEHNGAVTENRCGAASDNSPVAVTRQTYDLIAPVFAERTAKPAPEQVQLLDRLVSTVPAGGLVADIGCGPGRDVALLRRQGLHVIGLDLSIGQLRASTERGVVQADMRRLPLRVGSVDAIWCQAALLHMPRVVVPEVLAEFARVLRRGGALSMSVAEGDGEGFEIASNYGSDQRRWFTLHHEPELVALLGAAGFIVQHASRTRAGRNWLAIEATR